MSEPKTYIDALLENEDTQSFLENHEDLIQEAVSATYDYGKTLKAFVLENFDEFIGANLEETYKNIRLFSEVATMTFINEAVHVQAASLPENDSLQEGGINDYL